MTRVREWKARRRRRSRRRRRRRRGRRRRRKRRRQHLLIMNYDLYGLSLFNKPTIIKKG